MQLRPHNPTAFARLMCQSAGFDMGQLECARSHTGRGFHITFAFPPPQPACRVRDLPLLPEQDSLLPPARASSAEAAAIEGEDFLPELPDAPADADAAEPPALVPARNSLAIAVARARIRRGHPYWRYEAAYAEVRELSSATVKTEDAHLDDNAWLFRTPSPGAAGPSSSLLMAPRRPRRAGAMAQVRLSSPGAERARRQQRELFKRYGSPSGFGRDQTPSDDGSDEGSSDSGTERGVSEERECI